MRICVCTTTPVVKCIYVQNFHFAKSQNEKSLKVFKISLTKSMFRATSAFLSCLKNHWRYLASPKISLFVNVGLTRDVPRGHTGPYAVWVIFLRAYAYRYFKKSTQNFTWQIFFQIDRLK